MNHFAKVQIYLHYVLDLWFAKAVLPRLRGVAYLTRFADDFVVCFQYRDDAERFLQVLCERLSKFNLTLSEKKTRLIEFGRFAEANAKEKGRRPETFNFLGFTHYCSRTRRGKFKVGRKTMGKRLSRAIKEVARWLREHRHNPIVEQQQHLNRVLTGHYNYYGIIGNCRRLQRFRTHVCHLWRKWLNRRSQRRTVTTDIFERILKKYPLKPARIRMERRYCPQL